MLQICSGRTALPLANVEPALLACLLACLQLSVDVDEDAVLSGLRTIVYPEVAA